MCESHELTGEWVCKQVLDIQLLGICTFNFCVWKKTDNMKTELKCSKGTLCGLFLREIKMLKDVYELQTLSYYVANSGLLLSSLSGLFVKP